MLVRLFHSSSWIIFFSIQRERKLKRSSLIVALVSLFSFLKATKCIAFHFSRFDVSTVSIVSQLGKISVQPHTTLCIQFLNRENNDKNNTFPLGKQICFTIVWGCAETLPSTLIWVFSSTFSQNSIQVLD